MIAAVYEPMTEAAAQKITSPRKRVEVVSRGLRSSQRQIFFAASFRGVTRERTMVEYLLRRGCRRSVRSISLMRDIRPIGDQLTAGNRASDTILAREASNDPPARHCHRIDR